MEDIYKKLNEIASSDKIAGVLILSPVLPPLEYEKLKAAIPQGKDVEGG